MKSISRVLPVLGFYGLTHRNNIFDIVVDFKKAFPKVFFCLVSFQLMTRSYSKKSLFQWPQLLWPYNTPFHLDYVNVVGTGIWGGDPEIRSFYGGTGTKPKKEGKRKVFFEGCGNFSLPPERKSVTANELKVLRGSFLWY